MTLIQTLLLAASAGLVLASMTIVFLGRKIQKMRTENTGALSDEAVSEIASRVSAELGAGPDARLDLLVVKLDQLRAEFDWVVGESLITQAVVLAQTGHSETEVAKSTGISGDEVEAIQRFRRVRRH